MGKQKFDFNVNQSLSRAEENTKIEQSEILTGVVGKIAKKIESPSVKSPLDEYKIVPRNKLRENKKNSYPQGSLDSLKETILDYGVQQDITAIYIMDEDFYVIEAGHRRKASVDLLIEEFESYTGDPDDERYKKYLKNVKKYEYGYVCKITGTILENITYDLEDEENLAGASNEVIDSEIRLHITNIQARNDDNGVRAKNIARLSKLYEEKNKRNPRNKQVNINKKIAEDLNMKERQVAYYKSLDNLIPELQEEFKKNKITIKEGSNYAQLSESEQKMILSLIKAGTENISKEQIEMLTKEKSILISKMVEKEMQLQVLQESLEEAKLKKEEPTVNNKENKNEKKDQEIDRLKKEIEGLNASLKVKKNDPPNPDVAMLVKADLQLKTTLVETEKLVKRVLDLSQSYKVMYDDNQIKEGLAVFNVSDCDRELEKIRKLLVV